jgi:small subunit ribosomal protein S1
MASEEQVVTKDEEVQVGAEVVQVDTAKEAQAPEPSEGRPARERRRSAQTVDMETVKPGAQFKGKVRNVVDFGAFVDIGVGRDGLVHISVLKQAGIDKTIQVGQTVDVVVRRVDPEDNRISLVLPDSGEDTSTKTSLRDLQVGSVVTGRVVRLAEFGAFVDIGAQTDGLVHVSQLPWSATNNPGEVLEVNDEVQVRILDVDMRKRRISLSMKEIAAQASEGQVKAQHAEPEERFPTAFEAAFEKARTEQRRRQRRVTK